MKRLSLIYICFMICALSVDAQIMKWVCRPQYDHIRVLNERLYMVGQEGKWGVMDISGKLLHEVVYDEITPFQNDRALLLKKGSNGYNEISAIISPDGKLVKSLNGLGYIASFEYPYYKEGLMVYVTNVKGQFRFGYLDINGNVAIPADYYYAAPFFNGLSVVRIRSGRTEYFGVINSSGGIAVYSDNPPLFLSSIIDNQTVAVINSRNSNKVVRMKLVRRAGEYVLSESEVLGEGYLPSFPNGNYSCMHYAGNAFYFDKALGYTGNSYSTERAGIKLPAYPEVEETQMCFRTSGGNKGIMLGGKDILAPQFTDIEALRKDVVSVTDGKGHKGILRLESSSAISFVDTEKHFEFIADEQPHLFWTLDLDGVSTDDVSVRISLPDGSSRMLDCMEIDGTNRIVLPYEFKAEKIDKLMEDHFDAVVYADDLEMFSTRLDVSYMYHRSIRRVYASAPEYTAPDGHAKITVTVESKVPLSERAYAVIDMKGGQTGKHAYFNSNGRASVSFDVNVPEDMTSLFSFLVTVDDGNAPSSHASCSATIKNYFLQ